MAGSTNRRWIGGANLECYMFTHKQLQECSIELITDMSTIASIKSPQISLEKEPMEFVNISESPKSEIQGFLASTKWRSLEIQIEANFDDIPAELRVTTYRENSIIVASVLEDMIWAYGSSASQMRITRLAKFVALCRRISEQFDVSCVLLGSEPCTVSEFAELCHQTNRSPASDVEDGLSDKSVQNLFEWYRDEYISRW